MVRNKPVSNREKAGLVICINMSTTKTEGQKQCKSIRANMNDDKCIDSNGVMLFHRSK